MTEINVIILFSLQRNEPSQTELGMCLQGEFRLCILCEYIIVTSGVATPGPIRAQAQVNF